MRRKIKVSGQFFYKRDSGLSTAKGQESGEATYNGTRFGQFEECRDGEVEKSVGDENEGGEQEGVASSYEKFDAPRDGCAQEGGEPEL